MSSEIPSKKYDGMHCNHEDYLRRFGKQAKLKSEAEDSMYGFT